MKKLTVRVVANNKIAPDHYKMVLASPYLAKNAKPGQFVNVRCGDSYTPLLRRPFGFHKINKNTIEILYKVVGQATRLLSEKKGSETLDVIGPLGNGFNWSTGQPGNRPTILVGGGHGIAPLVALAKKLASWPVRRLAGLTVIIGARTKDYVICEKDFKDLKIQVKVTTEDGSKGKKGLATDLLTSKLANRPTGQPATIYACGPKPMLKAVAQIAKKNRALCQVSLEEYIACGIGTCMGCAVKVRQLTSSKPANRPTGQPANYKMVCKDGPVFDAKEVIWRI